ncbi:MAG: hypothetical protein H0W08_11625 [Acidobacteria bacterium]|nr:hypothetical protein [Acidobacteriota bacterium]
MNRKRFERDALSDLERIAVQLKPLGIEMLRVERSAPDKQQIVAPDRDCAGIRLDQST